MNQSLNNLVLKVENFSNILLNKGFGQIQQVTSSPHVICFQCRVPGQTLYLYLGRGVMTQGFDFGTNKVPGFLRIQDKFLQYARRNWRGMQLKAISTSMKDRVLKFEGKIGPYRQSCFFFWRGRDLFFANIKSNDFSAELFTSWEGKRSLDPGVASSLDPEDLFSELGFGEVEFGQQKSKDFSFNDYIDEFSSESLSQHKITRDQKTLNKMKEEVKRFKAISIIERYKNENLEELRSVGEGRFKVKLTGLEGHFKKREYLFDKIKSWKKSQSNLQKRIEELEVRISNKSKTPLGHDKKYKIVQPIWSVEKNKTKITKQSSHIEFSYEKWSCYVGRTAQENDFIRKDKAKKNDWWLHLEGMKSGHLIVKSNGESLSVLDLSILGSALVELCSQVLADIPLIYTQVKNLKGVKGVPGMVTYKKEKHLKVVFDKDWRQKLSLIESHGID